MCLERSVMARRLCTLLIPAILAGGFACSSGESTRPENPISPYDPEFDTPADNKAAKEVGPVSPAEENQLLVDGIESYDAELYTAARTSFQQLQQKFPMSYYSVFVELKLADCHYFLGDYATAITLYQEFERLHPKHESLPYVVLQLANSHFAQYRGVMHDQAPAKEAIKHYRRVLAEFPTSAYAAVASHSLKRCNELLAAHEAYVADFYLKQGLADASRNRLEHLTTEFAASQATKEVAPALSEQLGGSGSVRVAGKPEPPSQPETPKPPLKAVKPELLAALSPPEPIVETPLVQSRGRLDAASQKTAENLQEQRKPPAPEKPAESSAPKITGPVLVAASLSCEQLPDQRILTAELLAPISVLGVREELDADKTRKTVLVDLAVHNQSSLPTALGAATERKCTSESDAFTFSAARDLKQGATASTRVGARLSFALDAERKWRLLSLKHPERVVAVIY